MATNITNKNMTEPNESMDMASGPAEDYRPRVYESQKTNLRMKLLEKVLLDKSIKVDKYKSIVKQIENAVYVDELSIIIEIADS